MSLAPRILPFWSPAEIEAAITPVIAHLQAGKTLAYPTETVYGFGGAVDYDAVERLVAMKSRPPEKPFLLLINSSAMLERIDLHLTPDAARLAAQHWPGPLTLVLPGGDRRIPPRLRGPEGGVAVRWTSHPGIARLLSVYGDPITSTSANRPGEPTAMSAHEVLEQWDDAVGRGQLLILGGGTLQSSPPSTVVDCTGSRPCVVRAGAIPVETLRESVPDLLGPA